MPLQKNGLNCPGNPWHSRASRNTAFHIFPARADYSRWWFAWCPKWIWCWAEARR